MAYRGQVMQTKAMHAQKKKSFVMAGEQLVQQYEASYRSDPAWLMEQHARPRLGLILAEMHALAHVGVSARQYSSRQLVLIAASGLTWQHVVPDGGDAESQSDVVSADTSGSSSSSSSNHSSSSGAHSVVLTVDDVCARAAGRPLVSAPVVDQVSARRRKLIRKLVRVLFGHLLRPTELTPATNQVVSTLNVNVQTKSMNFSFHSHGSNSVSCFSHHFCCLEPLFDFSADSMRSLFQCSFLARTSSFTSTQRYSIQDDQHFFLLLPFLFFLCFVFILFSVMNVRCIVLERRFVSRNFGSTRIGQKQTQRRIALVHATTLERIAFDHS
jgi:hypothetical protein